MRKNISGRLDRLERKSSEATRANSGVEAHLCEKDCGNCAHVTKPDAELREWLKSGGRAIFLDFSIDDASKHTPCAGEKRIQDMRRQIRAGGRVGAEGAK